jgi:peptidoglycan/xylan/chitin deacetylase (PgdA/CDA1 family)
VSARDDGVADAIRWTIGGPARPPDGAGDPGLRRRLLGWIVGLIALPISVLPFLAFARFDDTGKLMSLRAERAVKEPPSVTLPASDAAFYAGESAVYGGALVVLVYHGVMDDADREPESEGMVVGTRRFGEHLAMFEAAGFRTVSMEAVAAWQRGSAELPDRALLITFDDGRQDAILNAAPMLKRHGMRATMSVIGGAYEHAPAYHASPRDLRALRTDGWSIEAHAAESHTAIDAGDGRRLPYLAARRYLPAEGRLETLAEFRLRVRRELVAARDAASAIGGGEVVSFTWPFGAYGADSRTNDPALAAITVQEARAVYPLVFNDDGQDGYLPVTRDSDSGRLQRLRVDPTWDARELWNRIQVAVAAGAPTVRDAT